MPFNLLISNISLIIHKIRLLLLAVELKVPRLIMPKETLMHGLTNLISSMKMHIILTLSISKLLAIKVIMPIVLTMIPITVVQQSMMLAKVLIIIIDMTATIITETITLNIIPLLIK